MTNRAAFAFTLHYHSSSSWTWTWNLHLDLASSIVHSENISSFFLNHYSFFYRICCSVFLHLRFSYSRRPYHSAKGGVLTLTLQDIARVARSCSCPHQDKNKDKAGQEATYALIRQQRCAYSDGVLYCRGKPCSNMGAQTSRQMRTMNAAMRHSLRINTVFKTSKL